jgi:hypothetical protein
LAGNAIKTPFTESINRFGAKKANDALQLEGKELPASVVSFADNMVTASFQVTGYGALPAVTVGVAMSRYVRLPIQAGDKGILRAADAVLGGITGLGTGIAGPAKPGNLGALIFEPVSNTAWPDPIDPNAVEIGGPNGVVMKLENSPTSTCSIIANSSGITLRFGAHSIVINSSGVTIDGKAFLPHSHSGVTTGAGTTGPVV